MYAPSGAGRPESAPIRAQRGRHSTPIACGPPRSSGRPRFAPTSMLFWLIDPSPRRPAQRNRAVSGQASHWGDGGRRGARLRGGAARAGGLAHRLARWLHRTRLGGVAQGPPLFGLQLRDLAWLPGARFPITGHTIFPVTQSGKKHLESRGHHGGQSGEKPGKEQGEVRWRVRKVNNHEPTRNRSRN